MGDRRMAIRILGKGASWVLRCSRSLRVANWSIVSAMVSILILFAAFFGFSDNTAPTATITPSEENYNNGEKVQFRCDASSDSEGDSIYCNIRISKLNGNASTNESEICAFVPKNNHLSSKYKLNYNFSDPGEYVVELTVCEDRRWWHFGQNLSNKTTLEVTVSGDTKDIPRQPSSESGTEFETSRTSAELRIVSCSTNFKGKPISEINIVELNESDQFVEVNCDSYRPDGSMTRVTAELSFDDRDGWGNGETWYSYRFGGQSNDSERERMSALLRSIDPIVFARFKNDSFFLPLRAEGGTIKLKSLEFQINYSY